MKQETLPLFSGSKNLVRLVIGLPAGIFLAEVIAMIIVYFVEGPYPLTILIDALITTTLMLPLIYLLSYRPLMRNVTKRERAEEVMQFRLFLMQNAVTFRLDELLQFILDEIERLTGGTIGFFHFFHADQSVIQLQAWSTNTIQNMCQAEGKGSHYNLDQAGVWADCARLQQPIVHNDFARVKNRKGTPEGHAPITRILTVPILREGRVVSILGIGNKPDDFTPDDVELVATLADFAWDVVERKQAEDAQRESERKFRTLADWTYDWEQWVDPEEKLVYISPSCERSSGFRAEEFVANQELFFRIIHPDDRGNFDEHKELIHDATAGPANIEYRIIARDGSEHWLDHICRPLFSPEGRYLGRRISNRDITQRKLAEMEIQERIEKENQLTQTVNNIQMEIARDLHDTLGQNIGFLRMRLDFLNETHLQAPVDLKMEIENMLSVANESYDLVRGMLDMFQAGGVDDPLQLFAKYAAQVENRSVFKINVTSQGHPKALPPSEVRQLFFVFREALNNIEKHADANAVQVDLNWTDHQFNLSIKDDGRGFNLQDVPTSKHYGLKFMQERVESLKGAFSIESVGEKGTTIKVILPL